MSFFASGNCLTFHGDSGSDTTTGSYEKNRFSSLLFDDPVGVGDVAVVVVVVVVVEEDITGEGADDIMLLDLFGNDIIRNLSN